MHSLGYLVCTIASLLSGFALALPHALDSTIKATRSANTCADPSLVHTVYQAFNAPGTAHQLAFLQNFESSNSGAASIVFANELPAFNAWPTQQDFTFPLFQLGQDSPREVIYVLGANAASPPVISGFSPAGIVAWAYSSQVCGSVPLLSATLTSASDTYYTIDPFIHDGLIADGWTDTGVIAFVLPLNSS